MTNTLHTKYRPDDFQDVLGQQHVVDSLKDVLSRDACHAFIFQGPSGTGKTTLSRIIARTVGCGPGDIIEVDAATNTGIDAMRSITENIAYSTLGASKSRVYIIDEAHALSKAAWQSLLKSVEEPPKHVYWCFCTTESGKIPDTIRTRCNVYELKPVKPSLIFDLLKGVAEVEGLTVSDEVIDFVASKSSGSPRRGLTYLAQVSSCGNDLKAAASLLKESVDDGDAITIAKALLKGGVLWRDAMEMVKAVEDQNPESIRIAIVSYVTAVVRNAKTNDAAIRGLQIIEHFADPYPQGGIYPLIVSLGRSILAE
jgi:DNA polymerase-3 subunit gamma/tau